MSIHIHEQTAKEPQSFEELLQEIELLIELADVEELAQFYNSLEQGIQEL